MTFITLQEWMALFRDRIAVDRCMMSYKLACEMGGEALIAHAKAMDRRNHYLYCMFWDMDFGATKKKREIVSQHKAVKV